MKRWKMLFLCGSIPVGLSAAALANYLGLYEFSLDQTTRYFSDFAIFLFIASLPFVCVLRSLDADGHPAKEQEGKRLVIKLSREGFDALHAIMATQGDLSEKAALDRVLIEQQEEIRKNLQGN